MPSPRWDAERLLRHVLGWTRARLVADELAPVTDEATVALERLVSRRASREPLQHILGLQEFWRHEFEVSPDALIPRPETELLVEESLRLLEGLETPRVVDVGTGTGCIALSLAAERPDARVLGVEISSRALALARRNAARLELVHRVAWFAADLLAATRPGPTFDLVVSNPPYAPRHGALGLQPEVRDHEPATALYGGDDGLEVHRRLVSQVPARLRPGGHLALEIGFGQEDAVRGLCEAAGLRVDRVLPDLQSIPRVVVAGLL